MRQPSAAQTALALLLALLGVAAVFLKWHHAAFLGMGGSSTGWARWEGITTGCLFGAAVLCLLLSRRRTASRWWHAMGYFLLPLATVGLTCWYAWRFVPSSVKSRLGSGSRLGAAFREFGSGFAWSSIGTGVYAAFAMAVALVLLGLVPATSGPRNDRPPRNNGTPS